jgi:tetratricopeptide (TPR) repeat protein
MSDFSIAKRIGQIKFAQNDSLRNLDKMRLAQLIRLDNDYSSPSVFKEKSQRNFEGLELKSIFSIVTDRSSNKHIRVYTAADKTVYMLSIHNESIDSIKAQKKIELLNIAIRSNPHNANSYLNRAILYSSIKLYNQAFADYDKTIAIDSTNSMAYFSRANTRFRLLELLNLDKQTAAAKFKEFMQTDTKKITYLNHTFEMVNRDYTRSLELDSSFSYAWYNRASVKFVIHNLFDSESDLSKALECDSTLPEAYYNKGLMQIMLFDNALACINLSKAGELGVFESYEVMKKYCYR